MFRHIKAWDERRETGKETWNLERTVELAISTRNAARDQMALYLLARCPVKWVSDCRCAGSDGSDD